LAPLPRCTPRLSARSSTRNPQVTLLADNRTPTVTDVAGASRADSAITALWPRQVRCDDARRVVVIVASRRRSLAVAGRGQTELG
jgi:hypothetical protein